ncbi:MAG: hypothetical protein AAGH68_12280 [Pseudomonadota bacterium]
MNTESIFLGVGGLFLGIFVGMQVGGTDADRAERRLLKEVQSNVAEMQEQVASMSGQVAGLEDAVAAGEAGRAALGAQLDGAVADLGGQLDAMSSSVADSIAEAGAAQSAAIDERLAALSAPGAEVEAAPAVADAKADDPVEAAIDGVKVGETLSLLEGKARVFVSGIDGGTGRVRVAVNGQGLALLGGPEPVLFAVGDQQCTLNLDALAAGQAEMSANCVEAAKETTAAAAVFQASSEAIAAGTEPKGPGQTAWLLDGKARVFVSGVDAEARTARVAVNGLSTAIVGGPQPVNFSAGGEMCTLSVADIVDGRVQLAASCK